MPEKSEETGTHLAGFRNPASVEHPGDAHAPLPKKDRRRSLRRTASRQLLEDDTPSLPVRLIQSRTERELYEATLSANDHSDVLQDYVQCMTRRLCEIF